MLRPVDQYFAQQNEPVKSCLLFLRCYVLQYNPAVTETWKYKMPVYCYRGKMLFYFWIHKKFKSNGILLPYIGIIDGNLINDPDLIQENRARMKILLINPFEDINVNKVESLMSMMIGLRDV